MSNIFYMRQVFVKHEVIIFLTIKASKRLQRKESRIKFLKITTILSIEIKKKTYIRIKYKKTQ